MEKPLLWIAQNESQAWHAFIAASLSVCDTSKRGNEIMANLQFTSGMLGGSDFLVIHQPIRTVCNRLGCYAMIDGAIDRINLSDKNTLFSYCCKIVFSDAMMTDKKKVFLNYIKDKLQITKTFWDACIMTMWAFNQKNSLG